MTNNINLYLTALTAYVCTYLTSIHSYIHIYIQTPSVLFSAYTTPSPLKAQFMLPYLSFSIMIIHHAYQTKYSAPTLHIQFFSLIQLSPDLPITSISITNITINQLTIKPSANRLPLRLLCRFHRRDPHPPLFPVPLQPHAPLSWRSRCGASENGHVLAGWCAHGCAARDAGLWELGEEVVFEG